MFCASITLLHYFQEYKTGLPPPPPVKSLGRAKQPPGFMFLQYCNNVLTAQNMPMYLSCIAYIFNRGGDASHTNLLKKALVQHDPCTWDVAPKTCRGSSIFMLFQNFAAFQGRGL